MASFFHVDGSSESRLPVPAQSATKENHGMWVWWGQGLEGETDEVVFEQVRA